MPFARTGSGRESTQSAVRYDGGANGPDAYPEQRHTRPRGHAGSPVRHWPRHNLYEPVMPRVTPGGYDDEMDVLRVSA